MLKLVSSIEIQQFATFKEIKRSELIKFDFVTEIEIESSWQNLTETAQITIPKNLSFNVNGVKKSFAELNITSSDNITPLILQGDKIKIVLGYIRQVNGLDFIDTNIEFEGFITSINPRIPIVINCESEMYILKQVQAPNKIYKNISTENLIKDLIKTKQKEIDSFGVKFYVRSSLETFLNEYKIENQSIANVLNSLRNSPTNIQSYFRTTRRNGVNERKELRASGIVYFPQDRRDVFNDKERIREWVFDFQQNIIEDNLEHTRAEDTNIRVKAFSKVGKNRIEVTLPKNSSFGDLKVRQFQGVTDIKTLTKLAQEMLDIENYTGWKGSITVFGLPSVRHGDVVYLKDTVIPERQGGYLVKGVKKTFGQGGFRQIIELDIKVI